MPINFRNEGGASLHPEGDRFIAGGSDLWVRVFDYQTGAQMECLKVKRVYALCLAVFLFGAVRCGVVREGGQGGSFFPSMSFF